MNPAFRFRKGTTGFTISNNGSHYKKMSEYHNPDGIYLDPAIPVRGVHRVSVKAINYVYNLNPWQDTALAIALEPLRRPVDAVVWGIATCLGLYWASGDVYKKGVFLVKIDTWNIGNVVTLVVDMDRGEFWWEVDKEKRSVIYAMNIPKGERGAVHFLLFSHLPNAELEIIDGY